MTTQIETAPLTSTPGVRPRRRQALLAAEVVFLLALTVVAFLVRRGGLPTSGLWFDDSWVAAGAIHGRLDQIMTVGSGHPLFTAILMGWHQLDSRLNDLALPALLAGTITPVVLYLSLRDARYRRSVSALLAVVVVVARVDILYSGRVKPYTFDPVLILVVGLVLHRLIGRSWRWTTVALWTAFAVVLGLFSGFVMVATASAGVLLFLFARDDRWRRGVAVGAQAAAQLLLLRWAQHSTNLDAVEKTVQRLYDAHLTFHANPITFGSEVLTHLRRIAQVYPGGSGAWLTLFGLAAVIGLLLGALRPRRDAEGIWCRYLLLMLVAAFVGALRGDFPFGPTVFRLSSTGGRYMVWVTPVIAFGLAAALQRLLGLADHVPARRLVPSVALGAVAVLVLLPGLRGAPGYPFPDSATAAAFAESTRQPGDTLLVLLGNVYSFADASHLPLALHAQPSREVGFTPVYDDPNVHSVGPYGTEPFTTATIRRDTRGQRRVIVVGADRTTAWIAPVESIMRHEGFREERHDWNGEYVLVFTQGARS